MSESAEMVGTGVKRYAYIDALRGIAILGVVLVHTSQWVAPASPVIGELSNLGARGVQLFYVASALTLFLSMEQRNTREARPYRNFYTRRFFRIAPLFYCAIIIYGLRGGLSAPRDWAPDGIEWWYIPITGIFLHGWLPETINAVVPGGWSVAIEMTFYLIAPILFRVVKDINLSAVAFFISVIVSLLVSRLVEKMLAHYYVDNRKFLLEAFSFFFFFSQLPVFMVGITVYHVIKRFPFLSFTASLRLLLLAATLLATLAGLSIWNNLFSDHIVWGMIWGVFSISLAHFPFRLVVNSAIVGLGKLSFSIYLSHFGVLVLLGKTPVKTLLSAGDLGFFQAYCLVLLVSVFVSWFSYMLVEVPGIRLGKRFISGD